MMKYDILAEKDISDITNDILKETGLTVKNHMAIFKIATITSKKDFSEKEKKDILKIFEDKFPLKEFKKFKIKKQ